MGDSYQTIVDETASEIEAPELAQRVLRWLIDEGVVVAETTDCTLGTDGHAPGPEAVKATGEIDAEDLRSLRTNGLAITTSRSVFDTGFSGEIELICSACRHRFEPIPLAFGDALAEWYEQSGPGELACPRCGSTRAVTEWQFERPFGFGCLGFTFWNWPTLQDEFVSAVSARLGHPVAVVCGRL